MVTRKTEKYPFSRGRPNSDLAEERRGSLSYYEKSDILQIIDSILNDFERLKRIDEIVTKDKIYQQYIRYAYNVKKEEKEQNEIAFRNSYKPIIQTEEIKQLKNYKKPKNQDLIPKFNDKILILKPNHTLGRPELNILYKAGALMFFNSLLSQLH